MAIGQNAWHTITGRKKNSVFNRLGFHGAKSADQTNLERIVCTMYVANFPSHFSVRELWNTCSRAGTVADVFIAKSRNKLGQMFAFVRYMNGDPAAIAKSLCTIRIGELWLHANPARHPRQPIIKQVKHDRPLPVPPLFGKPVVVGSKSYAKVVQGDSDKKEPLIREDSSPSVILTDEDVRDNAYPFALLGCYKDFRAIANTRSICQGEGFRDVQPVYLGGLWVLLDFVSLEARDKFLNHAPFKCWFDSPAVV